jgi:hypothetical protein
VRALASGCEGDAGAHDRREREGAAGAPATHGRERQPWRRGGGDAQLSLALAKNGEEGASTRRRKARWSCTQGESGNGGAVEEHDTGG